MASVNTNAAAITALRTLQQTNTSLDKTQARISTGYKIGEAKDNAAYWAISTTLKSDNKSLSTVKDALGLGASTVDVAYQGLNKAKDVLDEIKSKLTAATQDGVNRDTIQNEITQLQDQLKSIATSSVFSGENWLSVDTSAVSYNANKQVVASFSRDMNGSVAIGTIGVNIANVALFDASTATNAGGIVDGSVNLKDRDGRDLAIGGTTVTVGNAATGGLAQASQKGMAAGSTTTATTLGGSASASTTAYTGTLTNSGTALASGDVVTVTLSNGATITVNMTGSTLSYSDIGSGSLSGGSPAATKAYSGSTLTFTNSANGSTAAPTITSITAVDSSAVTKAVNFGTLTPSGSTTGSSTATAAVVKTATAVSASDLTIGDKLTVTFNNNGTTSTVTSAALTAATLSDAASKLQAAMSGVNVTVGTGADEGKLIFTASGTGAKSAFDIGALTLADGAGTAKFLTGGLSTTDTAAKVGTSAAFASMTLDNDDHLYFDIKLDGATASKLVTIDKALVNKALSTTAAPVTNGTIATVADFKKVVDAALAASNLGSAVTTVVGGASLDRLIFASATTGANSAIAVSNVTASKGGNQISIDNLDISAAGLSKLNVTTSDDIKKVLSAYIDVVNTAINKVTSAAASLGSVASRIDTQKSFVDTLMDTIDKGVGNLIDADMSEESTKLQALQVKQQLGVQALSIANQASQNILSLFRS